MRIDNVKLRHFRSHRHTSVQLERINFIRGLNKSGKSGIALAIEMALSGRCAKTDEAGKGYEQLIEWGSQAATVVLECPDAVISITLDRITGRTFKVELCGRVILGKQAQEWVAENIGAPDIINAALNAWRFIRMSEREQSSLLARVLLPEKLELSSEVQTWLASNRLSIVERPTLFATIEATHKAITFARTEVNRKIRDLKAAVEPEPITGSRDEIKVKLTALQTEQTDINEKILILSNREAIAKQTAEQAVDRKKQIEAKEKYLRELPLLLTSDELTHLRKIAALRPRHLEINSMLAAERATLANIEQTVERLGKFDEQGICPTCKTQLTEETRKAMFKPLLDAQNQARAAIKRHEKELADGGDVEAAAIELHGDSLKREGRLQMSSELEQLKVRHAQLEDTSSMRNESPHIEETIEALQQQLETLKPRIVRGLDALVKMVEREEEQKVYRAQMAERDTANTRLTELQKLLDYFGPEGIKAKLIAERLDLFTERVNTVLAWWGYSLSFTIEPYELRIRELDAPHIVLSPSQLSESESYRLGIAFALAIAEWTGLKFLIADAADILDKQDKWNLAQALLESDMDQAILISTGVAGTFEAAGTAFFTLSKSGGITATELDASTPTQATEQVETAVGYGA